MPSRPQGRGSRNTPAQSPAASIPAASIRPPAPAAAPNDKTQLDALLSTLETARGRRALVYWTTDAARVSEGATLTFYDQLESIGRVPALDLVLATRGGDTEAPYRIVSLIREYADKLAVLVGYRALSSGTLIALGADEIVMTPLGALGPIDPTRTHPLLPRVQGATEAEPVSVQDTRVPVLRVDTSPSS
jgi:membrane-bound ClpP family serine protease